MRILHTMLRVGNLDDSINFYTNKIGMNLLRKQDYPDGKFTLAFVGFGDEENNSVLELTHNWDTSSYEIGQAYGHIALEVNDIYKKCEELENSGVSVIRKPGPMQHGTTLIAFIEDPDGYKIELIQK